MFVFVGVGFVDDAQHFFGVVEALLNECFLGFYNAFDARLEFVELVFVAFWRRACNNKGRTGVVNKDGIDLIDNCEMVLALHDVVDVAGHVVTEVVKAKFVVGSESDIC